MRPLCTFIFSALAISSFGQNSEYNYFWDWEFQKSEYQPIRYEPSENVSQINYTVVNKRGSETNFVKVYDTKGNLLSYSKLNESKNQVPIVQFEYDDRNERITSKSYRKGKLKAAAFKTYGDSGELISWRKEKEKGKVVLSNTWEYNSDECLSRSTRFKGNGKVSRRWEYTYHSDCDKSKTQLFNGKGKLLKTWVYDCKEEGEVLEKKKDETQVCIYDESSKDYLLKVYERYDDKGRLYKSVSKYTLPDTLIVESSQYDMEGRMTYQAEYDNDYKRPLQSTSYRKGKKLHENVYEYENTKVVSHTYSYKDKTRGRTLYTYGDGLLTEVKVYDKKGDLSGSTKLSFDRVSAYR